MLDKTQKEAEKEIWGGKSFMKKIAIVTLYGNVNFGNKLQNYAIQNIYRKMGFDVETLKISNSNYDRLKIEFLNKIISIVVNFYRSNVIVHKYRNNNFRLFEKKYLKNSKRDVYYFNIRKISNKFFKFSIGSDQVWNPVGGLDKKIKFLNVVKSSKKISFSASFGVDRIPQQDIAYYTEGLSSIQYISVREEKGKELIKSLTGRQDVEVLVDPTMLLTAEEWDKVSKKPKQLKTDKYILTYFLGELSNQRKTEIEKVAKENNCEIINLLDRDSEFYATGPSEFLYLEKHAFLVCTDSFHSSVFALLYNIPFVIFDREQKEIESMNSRIDTLINKFRLKSRRYNGINITKENLEHDYTEAYKILEIERTKSETFLKKALEDIKG